MTEFIEYTNFDVYLEKGVPTTIHNVKELALNAIDNSD